MRDARPVLENSTACHVVDAIVAHCVLVVVTVVVVAVGVWWVGLVIEAAPLGVWLMWSDHFLSLGLAGRVLVSCVGCPAALVVGVPC